MKLTKLCRGNDTDAEFFFFELSFDLDDEKIFAICIESNELRLLAISDKNLKSISKECDPDNGYDFEIETINSKGQKKESSSVISIECCMEYLYDNALETYECEKSDIGDEGLSEAMESELAVPLLLAYDHLRCTDEEKNYCPFDVLDDAGFVDDFDCTYW